MSSKPLIVYYSRSGQNYAAGRLVDLPVGNTQIAAEMLRAATGGELLKLETVKAYPAGYEETTIVARRESRERARPELRGLPDDIDAHCTLFLGYPNWWGTAPMAVFSFLESFDFSGRTIAPFCTHEGSGMGHSERDIRNACPGAHVLDGLAIRGGGVNGAEDEIRRWAETCVTSAYSAGSAE